MYVIVTVCICVYDRSSWQAPQEYGLKRCRAQGKEMMMMKDYMLMLMMMLPGSTLPLDSICLSTHCKLIRPISITICYIQGSSYVEE